MARLKQTKGTCTYCGKEMTKASMSNGVIDNDGSRPGNSTAKA